MAEQFLQRPEVGAAAEQMGGEAVAKRVRSRSFRQAEHATRLHHRAADDLAAQRAAARAAEQGFDLRNRPGAEREIMLDRHAHRFEQASVGTRVAIPVNPEGWDMVLVKR